MKNILSVVILLGVCTSCTLLKNGSKESTPLPNPTLIEEAFIQTDKTLDNLLQDFWIINHSLTFNENRPIILIGIMTDNTGKFPAQLDYISFIEQKLARSSGIRVIQSENWQSVFKNDTITIDKKKVLQWGQSQNAQYIFNGEASYSDSITQNTLVIDWWVWSVDNGSKVWNKRDTYNIPSE